MNEPQNVKSTESWEFTRSIPLLELNDPEDGERVEGMLRELPGVLRADADARKHRIRVCYDPRRIFFEDLTEFLENNGYGLPKGRWQRIKAGWFGFTDQNARDNANAPPPACCNKPPK